MAAPARRVGSLESLTVAHARIPLHSTAGIAGLIFRERTTDDSDCPQWRGQKTLPAAMTCAGLIAHLSLTGKRVAVSATATSCRKAATIQKWLADGDRLELVVAVGGG